MVKRGRMIYVPKNVLDTLFEIKERERFSRNRDAWDKLAFLGGVGLNVEDGIDTLFGIKPIKDRRRKK